MAEEIAGLPHWKVGFDEQGTPDQTDVDALLRELPGRGLTDLFVFAHGWNNDRRQAHRLYTRFFEQMPGVLQQVGVAGSRLATTGTLGVIWPSKRWADEPDPSQPDGPAAGLADRAPSMSDRELVEDIKRVFPDPAQQQALDRLAELLEEDWDDPATAEQFQQELRRLAGEPDAASEEDDPHEELAMLSDPPEQAFRRFADVAAVSAEEEPAAGLFGTALARVKNGAREALRGLTYFEMKKRAGAIGSRGLGPLLGQLHRSHPDLRLHLIGHSFGARLVSFALAGLPQSDGGSSPVKSILLLQGAFSHYAFADALPHAPDRGGALKGQAGRVDGPLLVSFTAHDLAVARLYPLASLRSGEDAAGLDEWMRRWGGMGFDGAQEVGAVIRPVAAVGARYPFQPGRFINLDGNQLMTQGGGLFGAHSDVFHPELVWVALTASGVAGPA